MARWFTAERGVWEITPLTCRIPREASLISLVIFNVALALTSVPGNTTRAPFAPTDSASPINGPNRSEIRHDSCWNINEAEIGRGDSRDPCISSSFFPQVAVQWATFLAWGKTHGSSPADLDSFILTSLCFTSFGAAYTGSVVAAI